MLTRALASTAAATALLGIVSAPASAEVYGAVRAGFNDASVAGIDLDQGQTFEAALGAEAFGFRIEAGASKSTAELFGSVEGEMTTYSATLIKDVDLGSVTAFAGVGLNYNEAEVGAFGVSGAGDAWHYDLGASANINESWTLELRRRAIQDLTLDVDFIGDVPAEATVWSLGLRHSF